MTKMKMFMNKIMLLTTAVLIMIIVSGEIMYNKAANTVDTAWSFYFQTSSWNYSYTSVRQKEDYSKSYCYVQNKDSGLKSMFVAPFAIETANTAPGAGTISSTTGEPYIIRTIGRYHISNYTKERGYGYESLGMRSANGTGFASGKWSPDSAYSGNDIVVLPQ